MPKPEPHSVEDEVNAFPQPASPQVPEPEPTPEVPWRWTEALWVFFLSMLAFIPLAALVRQGLPAEATIPLATGVLAVITVATVRVRHGAGAPRLLLGGGGFRARDLSAGLGIAVAAYLLINIGLSLLFAGRELPEVQEGIREAALDPRTTIWIVVTALIVAPIGEELFFRGLLFQGLRRSLGEWPAIGLSSVVFALAHAQETLQGTLLLFLAFFPLGMVFAWIFQRRRSLVAPISAHAAYNGLSFAALYLSQRMLQ